MEQSFCNISWLWYSISVIVVFMLGWFWYSVLFVKKYISLTDGKCSCGADFFKGEKCTCKKDISFLLTFLLQLIATAFLGFMYFILTKNCLWIGLIVAIAISGWLKAMFRFQYPETKRWIDKSIIEVGYFFVSSIIFILFSLI